MEKVLLRPMTPEEFSAWKAFSKENYAKEKEKEGLSPDDAKAVAEKSFRDLLPEDERSPNQFLFSVVEKETNQVVGNLWWGLQKQGQKLVPWIYDINLDSNQRGKGLGRATMLAAEANVKEKGYSRLGLHVFGHNTVARALYDSMGFKPTNVVMYKDL